jgi:glycine betaine/choline ABC-type transport system substrate-binding protein
VFAALATLLGLLLVACSGGGSSSSGATSTVGPAALPGAFRPPLTLGTKAFTEQAIVGELYKRALEAAGYTVN